jgi:hypothetical protein
MAQAWDDLQPRQGVRPRLEEIKLRESSSEQTIRDSGAQIILRE